MKIAIIGLGLMGSSFALALKKRYKDEQKIKIIGMDINFQHCLEALDRKIVDKITDDIADILDANLIVISIPVDAIISLLPELKNIAPHTTIIDFGSTKEKIVNAIPKEIRANFVASHPMTGKETTGPLAADKKLYRGKVVVLCDTEKNSPEHLKFAKDIYKDLGMKIIYMGAKEHDRHAAYISHMPHAVSFAIANSVLAQENPKAIIALAGGGFVSMSRIAKSSPAMWSDIFKQNKENVLSSIESFSSELNRLKEKIEQEDWQGVNDIMKDANKIHDILKP